MAKHDLQRAFGDVVRERRIKQGISQEALADAAGLHRTYISLLERGERNPSLAVLLQLASGLNVSASVLLADLESKLRRK
ncbi:MAG TPA: helix-turn-helix transcriptional regulator [Pirellulales bacterium]|nr:helix-turn-helix transcriptional regulator [Pirellulales bacterium]